MHPIVVPLVDTADARLSAADAPPPASARDALLGTVLGTFPETLGELLRQAGHPERAAARVPAAGRGHRARRPIAGTPIESPATGAGDAPPDIEIEFDLDRAPLPGRSIEQDACGHVRVVSDFVVHVGEGRDDRALWGNLYPSGAPVDEVEAAMSALLHAAANLTAGDLGEAARRVIAVTDALELFDRLGRDYQVVLLSKDGTLVDHSLR